LVNPHPPFKPLNFMCMLFIYTPGISISLFKNCIYLFIYFILRLEIWALHLPGRCFTTWFMPPALLAFIKLQITSHIYAWNSLDLNPSTYASYIAVMTSTCYLTQLLY
jgi:hypothetical protein